MRYDPEGPAVIKGLTFTVKPSEKVSRITGIFNTFVKPCWFVRLVSLVELVPENHR